MLAGLVTAAGAVVVPPAAAIVSLSYSQSSLHELGGKDISTVELYIYDRPVRRYGRTESSVCDSFYMPLKLYGFWLAWPIVGVRMMLHLFSSRFERTSTVARALRKGEWWSRDSRNRC